MRDKVPGVTVPDDVYRRLRAVPADQTAAEGARLAAETIQQLRAIDGVAGVHLLVAGNEQAVPGILDEPRRRGSISRAQVGHSMDVDLRPVKKLRESAAARSALGPIMEAVCASPADLARLRVVCDWIQYKQNFREPVVSRPVGDTDTEIAFDLRRCADIDPEAAHVKQALSEEQPGLALEPWVPGRDSCIWRFNQLYWQALSALGGGHRPGVRAVAARRRERRAEHRGRPGAHPGAVPALGRARRPPRAARGAVRARARRGQRQPGPHLAGRVRPARPQARPRVLPPAPLPDGRLLPARPRTGPPAVAHHAERVSALVVEATRPSVTLGFLSGKAFLVYISNVYDNLPTDELACIHGRTYRVETQAFLTEEDASRIADRFGAGRDELVPAHRPAAADRPRAAQRVLARPVPRPRPGGRVLAGDLGGAPAAGTLRPAGGPGQLPDHPRR